MKSHFFATAFLSLFCCARLAAQQPTVESLTIADGLSQGMIYDIEQTDDGFLWFATRDGLNRYDGYNFEVFTHDPFNPFSIAGNDICRLFKDSRGNLWLSILGKGLDMLEKNSGRFFHFKTLAGQHNFSEPIDFAETSDGTIWVGTADGLFRLRWIKSGFVNIDNPDLEASMTVKWVSRGKKSDRMQFANLSVNNDGTLTTQIRSDGIYNFTPEDGSLRSILPAPDDRIHVGNSSGKVWIADNNRVYMIENGHSLKETWLGAYVHPLHENGIFPDGLGNLFFTSKENNHYCIYSLPEAEAFHKRPNVQPGLIHVLNEGFPTDLKFDQSGNLWIGTNGYGIRKINLSRQPFKHFLAGMSIGPVNFDWAVDLQSVEMYPLKYDESSSTLQREKEPQINTSLNIHILNALRAKNGVTYYAGWVGIYGPNQFLGVKNALKTAWIKTEVLVNKYSPFLEDSKGNIWFGGQGRLMCFQPPTESITYLDFSKKLDGVVYALCEDAQHNLWVGTQNGMMKMDIGSLDLRQSSGQTITQFPITVFQTDPSDPHSLRHNFVTTFCPDPYAPERFLWVSTKGGGLNLLDKNTTEKSGQAGEFQHFTSQNSGLPNDVVYGILPDDQGNLWMSTNRGLSRLTIDVGQDGQRSYRFCNFREYDGLQSDEFNTGSFARCPDRSQAGRGVQLLFGGVNGLTAFYPSEIVDRKSDAPVIITGLKINNKPVDYFQKNSPLNRPIHHIDQLQLDYDQNNVTLDFALMDFVTPQENRYRYRLNGADPDWVDAGRNHSANYTRLASGTYLFEVQGSIAGGVWSAPTTLRITILPPWWRTWWAYGAYGFALVALILFIRKYELNRIAVREEARHIKELDSAKTRLYTNITHEFRTPLTVIMGMMDTITGHEHARSLVLRNSRQLLHLINQMLDLAKLESGSMQLHNHQTDIVRFLRYLTESFYSLARERSIHLAFSSEEAELVMDFDEEKLQHLVYNLLSNALKFTPPNSGGSVELQAQKTEQAGQNWLQLEVRDTGIGIAEENLPHIFDRFYQADPDTSGHTRSSEGTGIGLALTKEFVEFMGGRIAARSTLGEGSTFTILLPVKNDAPFAKNKSVENELPLPELAAPALATSLATARLNKQLTGEKPLLLIVEDNRDVATYIRTLLEKDYQIEAAPNGKAGLEMALELVPDIIISDVMMPEMDGFTLTETLKTDERTSHIPIILLTAKAEEQDRLTGLRTGADAYLVKPFNKAELLVRLEKLTELRRRLQERYAGLAVPPADSAPAGTEDVFLQKLIQLVEAHFDDPEFAAAQLYTAAHMSQPQLYRKLMALTGKSPALFIRFIRLRKAADMLRNPELNISEIAWATGFNDPSYFSRVFHEEFGKTPGEWRS